MASNGYGAPPAKFGSAAASSGGVLSSLKAFDAFPKQRDEAAEFFHRTMSGGIITLVSAAIMTLLFFSELNLFMRVKTTNELSVDTSRGEQLQINFDVTFAHMPCSWMSVDVMDVSGESQLDVDHDVYKRRLSPTGEALDSGTKHTVGPLPGKPNGTDAAAVAPTEAAKPACGSCYGAGVEGQCCNTCTEVREAYRSKGWTLTEIGHVEQCHAEDLAIDIGAQRGEGCHVWGQLTINKVAGNFHFAPGRSFQQGPMHVHDLSPFGAEVFDFSHTIHRLSFGQEYPGMHNPLDGVSVQQPSESLSHGASGVYQYFLKVVPTTYRPLGTNTTIVTNQFALTEHFREARPGYGQQLPGLFIFHDLSPIKVGFEEERPSFLGFLTSVCAIVGGVFTVSGIIDATVYHGHKALKKKLELGKLH